MSNKTKTQPKAATATAEFEQTPKRNRKQEFTHDCTKDGHSPDVRSFPITANVTRCARCPHIFTTAEARELNQKYWHQTEPTDASDGQPNGHNENENVA